MIKASFLIFFFLLNHIVFAQVGRSQARKLGLEWLAKNQEADGHWDSGKHDGAGTHEADVTVTAAALIAFLGDGHTVRVGKYKSHVKLAIDWLIQTQKPNGSWVNKNEVNGLCTMAIAEAHGMGCGEEVKKSATNAVEFLLKQQNKAGAFVESESSKIVDIISNGCCIQGLMSAKISGINEKKIKKAFKKYSKFLDKTDGTNDNKPTSKGIAWYTPDKLQADGTLSQAIAMLTRQYTGWDRSQPWLEAAAKGQAANLPKEYAEADIYRVYFAYLALFQQGGMPWKEWDSPVTKIMCSAQRQDGDFKGSWDKNGSQIDSGGRVLYTAYICVTLQVYYCYESPLRDD